ncbi:dihydrofolate reductase family protein [Paenibacillus oryzisoli]|uniref:dihydrofolate reductase family protein n=1 Tax=Paenibacillus oryzisoli TaxID=1850517 RepID=UPI003D280517
MRKIIVLEHVSLDGVIQAPGGPDEDRDDGFAYGGWSVPYVNEGVGTLVRKQMNKTIDLLLGRKTYEVWASYWPQHGDIWPMANQATKYVASNTMTSGEWHPTVVLRGDIAEQIAQIKQQPGPELHVWGSGDLAQTLIRHDLVDAFWLIIYPITLGSGKRLFGDGTIPAAFKVAESTVAPNGVIVVNYERAGEVKTGSMEA